MTLEMVQVSPDVIPIVAILSVFVLFPIAIGLSRLIWKRASEPPRRLPDDTGRKLDRMQEAIDTMAIEIERISEGQRFMTKVLSERAPAVLPREGDRPAP